MNSELNSLIKEDFILLGDTKLIGLDDDCKKSLIDEDERNTFFVTFSEGDKLMTYRGISINSSMRDVFVRYGEEELLPFDYKNDEVLRITLEANNHSVVVNNCTDELGDFKCFRGDEKWVEYSYPVLKTKMIYLLRFYFDSYGKVVLISYFSLDCNFKSLMKPKKKKLKRVKYLNGYSTQSCTFKFKIKP